jgi:hypothetical protein
MSRKQAAADIELLREISVPFKRTARAKKRPSARSLR